MKNAIIGIDVGGTSIKMGLIDQEGHILHTQESPTPLQEGYRKVLDAFNNMSEKLLQETAYHWENIVGVGIGVPAFLDLSKGIVVEAVNLGWYQVPLKEELERMWNVPVMVENDANAAALGEMWIGAGKGASNLICLTLGTGVGGGVIINGDIYHGVNGSAGEVGHIKVREQGGRTCNCGKQGCLETEASATAIALDALEQVGRMSAGALKEEYDRAGTITAKSVIELANLGDSTCRAIIAKAGTVLGNALANMCYLLNPEKVVIGGGVSSAGDILFDPLVKAFQSAVLPRVAENTSIVAAKLGNQAGMVGAAWLIYKKCTRA
ncbi:MAG: ROK family glucokinase [Desulfitobacteriaceae bacterium]